MFDVRGHRLKVLIRDKISFVCVAHLTRRRQILFVGAVSLFPMHNSGILERLYWANQKNKEL